MKTINFSIIIWIVLTVNVCSSAQIQDTINFYNATFDDQSKLSRNWQDRRSSMTMLKQPSNYYRVKVADSSKYIMDILRDLNTEDSRFMEQIDIKDVPIGTRTIVVSVPNKNGKFFVEVLRRLIEFGYGIDKYDKEIGYIQSKASSSKVTYSEVVFYILLRDNKLQIKGDYRGSGQHGNISPWEEIRNENTFFTSISKSCFIEMFDFARSFASGSFEFLLW